MWKYRQYCPVARASEIFADRWTPLIVRELLAGSSHFNHIHRGLPGVSRTLLSTRLRTLEDVGVLTRETGARPGATEYHLTAAGEDLGAVIDRLGQWGARWAFGEPRPEELDPVLLLWKVRRRIQHDRLPKGGAVIEFEFTGKRLRRLWLVLRRNEASLCLKPSGFDTDLLVQTDVATWYNVWLHRTSFAAAVRTGKLRVEGPTALVRAFPQWLQWSPMAEHVRAAALERTPSLAGSSR